MIDGEASPFDDLYLEYVNPLNGAAVMPSMGCYAQCLRPGVKTRLHRHTSSVVYYTLTGLKATFSTCPDGTGTLTPTARRRKMLT